MNDNNNENQNLNVVTPSVNSVPTEPVVPVDPTPVTPNIVGNSEPVVTPVPTVTETPVVEPVVETPVSPVVSTPSVTPTEVVSPTVVPVVSEPVVSPVESAPIEQTPQQVESINLMPEGTAPVTPVTEMPPAPVEPLMSTSLNEQTVLTPPIDNSMNSIPTDMNSQVPPIVPAPPVNDGLMSGIPVPPAIPTDDKKNKKTLNKTTLILLVVVLILIVGVGVYFVLNSSKKKSSGGITPKLSQVELGTNIPLSDASYFVTLNGVSASSCTVETSLNTYVAGTYEYSVTCGNQTSKGNQVVVKDTVAPEVVLKDVVVPTNTMVLPMSFVEGIEDASDSYSCTASFVEEPDTSSEGEYEVNLIVSDVYGNEVSVVGNLIVTDDAPIYYLSCTAPNQSTDFLATTTIEYKYGVNLAGNLYNTRRYITYQFENIDDYLNAVDTITDNTFDGNDGTIIKSKEDYTIRVARDFAVTDLAKEFSLNPFPTLEDEISKFHENRGETCTILSE